MMPDICVGARRSFCLCVAPPDAVMSAKQVNGNSDLDDGCDEQEWRHEHVAQRRVKHNVRDAGRHDACGDRDYGRWSALPLRKSHADARRQRDGNGARKEKGRRAHGHAS